MTIARERPADLRPRFLATGTAIAARMRHDYFEPDRLEELRQLLVTALELGYEPMTLTAFASRIAARDDRILLLRHDVDDDVRRARRMWAIERQLGLTGSFFFRRRTWDVPFMRELAAAGNDVGYHYEELATLVKANGAETAEDARMLIAEARGRLLSSLGELRARSGLPLDVAASHGDFANRAVGVANVELLADEAFRAQAGVRLEAYDIEPDVDARWADCGRTEPWHSPDPMHALRRDGRVVELLLHPRAWGAAPMVNARADLRRLSEGAIYRLRCARRRRRPAQA
jgi:hypothetical protein